MSNPEWDKFGSPIGGTRWFNGDVEISDRLVQTYEQRWLCPIKPCDGEMKFNGMTWLTGNPGYHHTCDKCGFTAAVHARYPRIVNR